MEKKHTPLKVRGEIFSKNPSAGHTTSAQKIDAAQHVQNVTNAVVSNKILVAGILLLLIIAIVYMTFFYKPYTYTFAIDGVHYYSNEYTPTTFFGQFNDTNVVILSPILYNDNTNHLVNNNLILWKVILTAKGKTAISVIREQDGAGNLTQCTTDYGDINKSEQLTPQKCLAMLADTTKMKVFLEKSAENKAILSQNSLALYYADPKQSSTESMLVLTQIYSDAQAVLDRINAIISQKIN